MSYRGISQFSTCIREQYGTERLHPVVPVVGPEPRMVAPQRPDLVPQLGPGWHRRETHLGGEEGDVVGLDAVPGLGEGGDEAVVEAGAHHHI